MALARSGDRAAMRSAFAAPAIVERVPSNRHGVPAWREARLPRWAQGTASLRQASVLLFGADRIRHAPPVQGGSARGSAFNVRVSQPSTARWRIVVDGPTTIRLTAQDSHVSDSAAERGPPAIGRTHGAGVRRLARNERARRQEAEGRRERAPAEEPLSWLGGPPRCAAPAREPAGKVSLRRFFPNDLNAAPTQRPAAATPGRQRRPRGHRPFRR